MRLMVDLEVKKQQNTTLYTYIDKEGYEWEGISFDPPVSPQIILDSLKKVMAERKN